MARLISPTSSQVFHKRPDPAPRKSSKPFILHVGKLRIIGARAGRCGQMAHTPYKRLLARWIATGEFPHRPENQNPYSFSGTSDTAEQYAWSGLYRRPFAFDGEVAINKVALNKYARCIRTW